MAKYGIFVLNVIIVLIYRVAERQCGQLFTGLIFVHATLPVYVYIFSEYMYTITSISRFLYL